MKINELIGVGLIVLSLCACQGNAGEDVQSNSESSKDRIPAGEDPAEKMIEHLVGEWELYAPDTDSTTSHLQFTERARYVIYSDGQKIDSGAYRMNEQLGNLYLESEANKVVREYSVDLQPDVLILQGQDQSYTYRRGR